mmetsp:Transcript_27323/g.59819  ORF Transcript_27323/g.59819 Transcript_27323/m.59819 type:complete len:958 (+) Transcript_27323:3-2876(+)
MGGHGTTNFSGSATLPRHGQGGGGGVGVGARSPLAQPFPPPTAHDVPSSIGNGDSLSASPLVFDASPSPLDRSHDNSSIFATSVTSSSTGPAGGHHRHNLSSGGHSLPPPPPTLDVSGGGWRGPDAEGDGGGGGSGGMLFRDNGNKHDGLDESAMGATHRTDASSSVDSYSIAPRPFGTSTGGSVAGPRSSSPWNTIGTRGAGGGGGGGGAVGSHAAHGTDDSRSISSGTSGAGGSGSRIAFTDSFESAHHEDGLRGLETLRDRAQTVPNTLGIDPTMSSSSAPLPEEYDPPSAEAAAARFHRRNWSTGTGQGGDILLERGAQGDGGVGRTSSSSRLLSSSADGSGGGAAAKFLGRPPLATSKSNLVDMSSSSVGGGRGLESPREYQQIGTASGGAPSDGLLGASSSSRTSFRNANANMNSDGVPGRNLIGGHEHGIDGPRMADDRPVHGGDVYVSQQHNRPTVSPPRGYSYHPRSYSHDNVHKYANQAISDGNEYEPPHQQPQGGPAESSRHRFATSDDAYFLHGQQHWNGMQQNEDNLQNVMVRSVSAGTNVVDSSGYNREGMPMRRSDSVPGRIVPSSSHDELSIRGGGRFIDAYGQRSLGSGDYSDGYYAEDGHCRQPSLPARSYASEDMMRYDTYDRLPHQVPRRGASFHQGSPLQRGHERSRSGGKGVDFRHEPMPPSHHAYSTSQNGEYFDSRHVSHHHHSMHDREQVGVEGYHETIVLPQYGVATMPRPPAAARPAHGPKVVYTVKFKRLQRCFVLGPRCPRDIKTGTYVKVEADRGEHLGMVISQVSAEQFNASCRKNHRLLTAGAGFGDVPGAGPGPSCAAELKCITRLATREEIALLVPKGEEENELLLICRTKVQQRGLPMQVVDAEYQFDRHKLTFFFQADCRIDFRELVRDLFSIYKTRIWMQQLDKVSQDDELAAIDGENENIAAVRRDESEKGVQADCTGT